MSLYTKIDDYSILLDSDCKRMLKRNSRKHIIQEVLEKLSNIDNNQYKKETQETDQINEIEKIEKIDEINLKKNNLYEIVLNILGCNKS